MFVFQLYRNVVWILLASLNCCSHHRSSKFLDYSKKQPNWATVSAFQFFGFWVSLCFPNIRHGVIQRELLIIGSGCALSLNNTKCFFFFIFLGFGTVKTFSLLDHSIYNMQLKFLIYLYSSQISLKIVLPCLAAKSAYKIWLYSSCASQIPFLGIVSPTRGFIILGSIKGIVSPERG